jgi:hypothetical protein
MRPEKEIMEELEATRADMPKTDSTSDIYTRIKLRCYALALQWVLDEDEKNVEKS